MLTVRGALAFFLSMRSPAPTRMRAHTVSATQGEIQMFSTLANHVRSVVRSPSAMQWSRPVALTALRLPVARIQGGMASRIGGAHTFSARWMAGAPAGGRLRPWPAPEDAWDGAQQISPDGARACRAALETRLSRQAIDEARRKHAYRTGSGIDPELSLRATRIGMAMGLERSLQRVTHDDGPGVAAGLHALAIGPGDSVLEHDPDLPSLAVRMALDGADVYLALSHPARLREVNAEMDRYRRGDAPSIRTLRPDMKPLWPDEHYTEGARTVARRLTVVPGPGVDAVPEDVRLKALITRGAFDCLALPAIDATVRGLGRRLAPGGGLVFEFAHAASRPVPAVPGGGLGRIRFRDIAQALRDAGLDLQCLYVSFRIAGDPQRAVLAARRVLPDADGRISLTKADAAAWSGWNEISGQHDMQGRPLRVNVSGLFVKQGQAKG